MSDAWSDDLYRDALQLIAEGLAESLGFAVVAISVAREDGLLEFAAVAGDEATRAQIEGFVTPVEVILRALDDAEVWGHFRFVRHNDFSLDNPHIAYQSDREVPTEPEGWDPRDSLMAPIRDDRGELRGLLQVDEPLSGLRPDEATRARLERYAEQTRRAVLTTIEREEVGRRLHLARQVRAAVHGAAGHESVPALVEASGPGLLQAFQASRLWVRTFGDAPEDTSGIGIGDGWEPAPETLRRCGEFVEQLWTEQTVRALDEGDLRLLVVPIGVPEACVGYLVLGRPATGEPWREAERIAALDLGHDLGRAVRIDRLRAQEARVSADLRSIDHHRETFMRTVAHELKNPLAAITGHAALLTDAARRAEAADVSPQAILSAAGRMRSLVDHLLTLAQMQDPRHRLTTGPVDLTEIVTHVVEACSVVADRLDVRLVCDSVAPMRLTGSRVDLENCVNNLVANALAYTRPGDEVRVSVTGDEDSVTVRVTDTGIGIDPTEHERIFEDFVRGSDPEAQRSAGSGLGLAIVRRVVRLHGGMIEVDSASGQGSSFIVTLPRVPGS